MLNEKELILQASAIAFITGKGKDDQGRRIDEYFQFSEATMEDCHGWVQWAFPIDTVSRFNPKAGQIFKSKHTKRHYRKGSMAVRNQRIMLNKYLASIGIGPSNWWDIIDYHKFFQVIDSPTNHHMLRISRVLKHLVLSGDQQGAAFILETLMRAVVHSPSRFNVKTVAYWSSIVLEFDYQIKDKL